jgi:hypothetical protein
LVPPVQLSAEFCRVDLGGRKQDPTAKISRSASASPLQGPHRFYRIGHRIAHPSRNRLVIEALHILQGQFTSRDIGTYLLDHAVMMWARMERVKEVGADRSIGALICLEAQ